MAVRLSLAAILVAGCSLSGCSFLNMRAVPFGTTAPIHDQAAKAFLRKSLPVDIVPSSELAVKPLDDDHRLVGVAISGGGMRASAFTLGILAELGRITLPDGRTALEAIDFISSNSGGSWAVASYLADRAASGSSAYDLSHRYKVISEGFDKLARGKVECWAKRFPALTHNLTFAETYGAEGSRGELPRAFFNASVLPAQSPFVFTDGFIKHYQVSRFEGACTGASIDATAGLAQMSLGFAAATSGSVPAFTHSWAETRLCSAGELTPSFCFRRLKGGPRDHLHLNDGGLYDNLGYKTAFEVGRAAVAQEPTLHPGMIFIDSADDEAYQSVSRGDRHSDQVLKTLMSSTFPHQNATFRRLRQPIFESAGFKAEDQVLLDFNAGGAFREENARDLDDLGALAYFAANNVSCFDDEHRQRNAPQGVKSPVDYGSPSEHIRALKTRGADCLSENFARAGSLHKTTYTYDPYFFLVRYQLGRLVVRMRRNEILKALR